MVAGHHGLLNSRNIRVHEHLDCESEVLIMRLENSHTALMICCDRAFDSLKQADPGLTAAL